MRLAGRRRRRPAPQPHASAINASWHRRRTSRRFECPAPNISRGVPDCQRAPTNRPGPCCDIWPRSTGPCRHLANLGRTVGNRGVQPSRAGKIRRAEAQRRVLACFEGICNIVRDCRSAKVPRTRHYKWMTQDPGYAERVRASIKVAVGTLESEAVRRAHEGVCKPVFYKGEHVRDSEGGLVYETEYDSNLLMFLLRAYDPKRFVDKLRTTFDANWSGNLEDLPEEFLMQVLEWINAQIAATKAKQIEQGRPSRPLRLRRRPWTSKRTANPKCSLVSKFEALVLRHGADEPCASAKRPAHRSEIPNFPQTRTSGSR
jgi:hypothetical protein